MWGKVKSKKEKVKPAFSFRKALNNSGRHSGQAGDG
jgi:hypothetical protein